MDRLASPTLPTLPTLPESKAASAPTGSTTHSFGNLAEPSNLGTSPGPEKRRLLAPDVLQGHLVYNPRSRPRCKARMSRPSSSVGRAAVL